MSRFVEGVHREQSTLFPERIEDYITEEDPIRIAEAFVEEPDLFELGFTSAEPKAIGRPA